MKIVHLHWKLWAYSLKIYNTPNLSSKHIMKHLLIQMFLNLYSYNVYVWFFCEGFTNDPLPKMLVHKLVLQLKCWWKWLPVIVSTIYTKTHLQLKYFMRFIRICVNWEAGYCHCEFFKRIFIQFDFSNELRN